MTSKCPSCASCGMPMEKADDFALGKTTSEFCRYCVDDSGKLLPFETVLSANAGFFKESQGLTDAAAMKMAKDLLTSQPAWKHVGA